VRLALVLLAVVVSGQPHDLKPPTRLVWDHDHPGHVERFELSVDDGPMTVLTHALIGPFTYATDFPALTPGSHTLAIYACNRQGCQVSDQIRVKITVEVQP
jgi:hypothetical protein